MTFVGITGGREYSNREQAFRAIESIEARIEGGVVIVEGGADGADTLAREAALHFGLFYIEAPVKKPHWDRHGKPAGIIRNSIMAALPLRYLIAFPGGRGTADMVRRAKAKGIEVIEVSP